MKPCLHPVPAWPENQAGVSFPDLHTMQGLHDRDSFGTLAEWKSCLESRVAKKQAHHGEYKTVVAAAFTALLPQPCHLAALPAWNGVL